MDLALDMSTLAVLDCGTQVLVYAGQGVTGSSDAQTKRTPSSSDLAVSAAPAVQFAQQMARGRMPLPSVHILEGPEGVVELCRRLVPLHRDSVAVQMALLPGLCQLPEQQVGVLVELHSKLAMHGTMDGTAPLERPTLEQWCSSSNVALPVTANAADI